MLSPGTRSTSALETAMPSGLLVLPACERTSEEKSLALNWLLQGKPLTFTAAWKFRSHLGCMRQERGRRTEE